MNKMEKHWPGVLHYKYNLDIYKKVDITCYLYMNNMRDIDMKKL